MVRQGNRAVIPQRQMRGEAQRSAQAAAPAAVVGFAFAAMLMVLLLLMQARLSRLGFALSELEREVAALEKTHQKLVVTYADTFRLDRVEQYAAEKLGMVKPNPDQIYFIEIDSLREDWNGEN